EDLIAVISLYRPGPMDSIPTYIENRHNPEKIQYKHPLLKEILDVTYGCIVYQEQVMQIFRSLAGYSLGRADIVRRAMSKKKHDVMEKERKIFIEGYVDKDGKIEVEGCLRRGVDRTVAESIFSEMESFASYAFNKSHAASYATLAFQTAYLKCHYPKEYMAALMSSVLDNQNKLSVYINECQRMGISVLPPHVNYSYNGFTVVGDNIRFGLLAIKNIGKNVIEEIIEERKNGKFVSFYDFCSRMAGKSMNIRTLESFIKCGAVDNLGCNRRQMLLSASDIMNNLEYDRKKNLGGQMSLFDGESISREDREQKIPFAEDFSTEEKLHMEYEMTGMYLSGHPLSEYQGYIENKSLDKIGNILEDSKCYGDSKKVDIIVIISKVKNLVTKSNRMMAFVNAEDMTGTCECLVFPNVLEENSRIFYVGNIVEIVGHISLKEEEDPKIIVDFVKIVSDNMKNQKGTSNYGSNENISLGKKEIDKKGESEDNKKIGKIYLKLETLSGKKFDKVKNILSLFRGEIPVIFYTSQEKKQYIAPKNL
ncbi:MAG: DNA polymerase III subunit alpha, partial [Acutalibacteraceae bacterium]